jgi:hypothetical protein
MMNAFANCQGGDRKAKSAVATHILGSSLASRKLGAVLPNTGTRLVPECFWLIPEQIVLKEE